MPGARRRIRARLPTPPCSTRRTAVRVTTSTRFPKAQTLIGANGKLNPNAKLGYSDGQYYYTPDDWYDELFGSGNLRQEYNVSIAGASERLNYYLSAGYLDDSGIIKNSGFTRYSTV